jgi:Na+-translocating ferredoxin:NAD+ oxidoreductase RNF subunit RnfB
MEFLSYEIKSNDFKRAGDASRALKEHLKLVGADPESIRRTMIAAYEAEMNVVIHAQGGRLEAHLADVAIHVDVIDNGPGIPDLELAMKEGYSTANAEARALGFGAGMGLPNIKRSSDRLRVTSRVGKDGGTRVSFTVFFKREPTKPSWHVSLQASRALCQECGRCLITCPTEAIRIRDHMPTILEHLCIDCGACVAACKPEALTIRNDVSSLSEITEREQALLVVPPAVLVDCGAKYSPEQVLAALRSLGFAGVVSTVPYETALRKAVMDKSQEAGALLPVISPVCPAIVNLIELRFPSLIPYLAPFDSPLEAIQAEHPDEPMVYVVSCPGQRSALITHEIMGSLMPGRETITEYVTPIMTRQAVMERLVEEQPERAGSPPREGTRANAAQKSHVEGPGASARPNQPTPEGPALPLVVTGVDHVAAVLEQLEDGLLGGVTAIEPYACTGGCFGSPFLQEDYHVSLHRWEEAEHRLDFGCAPGEREGGSAGRVVARRLPVTARPGIRLDADMALAIEKLGRLQEILEVLPGKNCGACGAPTCTALAEDIVLQRAVITDCPYVDTKEGTGT